MKLPPFYQVVSPPSTLFLVTRCSHSLFLRCPVQKLSQDQTLSLSRSILRAAPITQRRAASTAPARAGSDTYTPPAQDLDSNVTKEEQRHYDKLVAEDKDKAIRTPWHREGADRPPVGTGRSAGAMTKGKLLTTPTRLFKLVLPLTTRDVNSDRKDHEPLALLVHPQQPLSYLERLIQAELPLLMIDGKERIPSVNFRAVDSLSDDIPLGERGSATEVKDADEEERKDDERETKAKEQEEEDKKKEKEKKASKSGDKEEKKKEGKEESEEDKAKQRERDRNADEERAKKEAREAAEKQERMLDEHEGPEDDSHTHLRRHTPETEAQLRGGHGEGGVESYSGLGHEAAEKDQDEGDENFIRWSKSTEIGDFVRDAARGREFSVEIEGAPREIRVGVPSFGDRTYYLRMRLRKRAREIASMADLKRECDLAAEAGAQRMAYAGFGGMVVWLGVVYYLTFRTDLGWDVMEPVTYLVGLAGILVGYGWFLLNKREASYRSAMNITISRRQQALYDSKGFDLRKWEYVMEEANALRREIIAVAHEYDVEWDEKRDAKDETVMEALKEHRHEKGKKSGKSKSKDSDDSD